MNHTVYIYETKKGRPRTGVSGSLDVKELGRGIYSPYNVVTVLKLLTIDNREIEPCSMCRESLICSTIAVEKLAVKLNQNAEFTIEYNVDILCNGNLGHEPGYYKLVCDVKCK